MVNDIKSEKRILIFSLVYYPRYIGGAEVAIKEITDRIPQSEISFDMITLRKHASEFERIGNVNVYRVGLPWSGKSSRVFPISKLIYPFLAYAKALQLHKVNRYDATWAMMASYAGFASYLFKRKYRDVPFILSLQEGDNFERREGIFKSLFTKIFANADYIQVISRFLEDWARHMGAKCPIKVVPNGVDYELFSEIENIPAPITKKEGDIFVITTSRLVEKNAVGDVIDSLPSLPSNVKFLILGTGYLEESLKKKVNMLKLNDRVKFLGYIPHSEMPQYLHISDIFIRPSLSEGFGNSYIEAMAAGIPVIATAVGGITDFLVDRETGIFCEVNSPKSISESIELLMKDIDLRNKIVTNAKKMVQERYEWSLIATNMKNEVFLSNI
jgi:glycosyltransferase involved in cell wall biosynthesis